MNALLDAALAYAARGWPVFPCQSSRKEPATPHGFHDATTSPEQIRAWWTTCPGYNIGIATGAPGPDVIDFDTDNAPVPGLAALTTLTQAGILGGRGLMVRTRSGGWHAYYDGTTQRNGSLKRAGAAVDFRATGGYVIAPPSFVEADEKPAGHYQTVSEGNNPPAVLDWRIARDLILPPPPPPAFQQPARDPAQPVTGRPGDAWAAATDWAAVLAPHGWRLMRQIGGVRYWQRPGKTGRGISASTRDDSGLYVFSTSTEFEAEVPYTKFGAYAVLSHGGDHKAAAAELRRDGYGTPEPVITFTPPPAPGGPDSGGGDWWSEIAARHTPLDWQKLFDETPEDEDWIVFPLLAAGRSVALYSPPKTGKSLLALEIAAAAATGRPVLSQPAGPGRTVLYVDLENSRRDIRDRLAALGYKPTDLTKLIYLSFPSLPALDSAQGGREIMALALAHQAEAVIIDTVSRVISGKENDADTFAALYRYAMAPLKGLGVAVLRLDHAGKDAGKGQRGSSAKNADVDAVWTLAVAGPVITLQCEMSRAEAETRALTLRRGKDPLRHEVVTPATGAVGRVQELMAKLDELGVPRDATNRQCQQALNRASVPVNTNHLREAVRTRKTQLNLSDDLETNDLEGIPRKPLSQDHQTSQTETGNQSPEQPKVLSQDHQTDGTDNGRGDSAKSVSNGRPPRRGAPVKTDAAAGDQPPPLCTGCGEHHHRYGPTGRPCFHQPAVAP